MACRGESRNAGEGCWMPARDARRSLLAIHRSCMFFFVITPLTGRNPPLKTPNMSLISDFVDTIG
jgi:hypothetical protein